MSPHCLSAPLCGSFEFQTCSINDLDLSEYFRQFKREGNFSYVEFEIKNRHFTNRSLIRYEYQQNKIMKDRSSRLVQVLGTWQVSTLDDRGRWWPVVVTSWYCGYKPFSALYTRIRVPTPTGKFWNLYWKISTTCKVQENEIGPVMQMAVFVYK